MLSASFAEVIEPSAISEATTASAGIFAPVTASFAIFAVVTELLARAFAPNVSISLTTPYAIEHPVLDTSAHPPVVLYTKSTLSPTSLNVIVEPFAKVVGVRTPSPPSATIVTIFN